MTKVTVEARNASGSVPHFTQSLYRGTAGLGSGVGVVVKDAADPSQPLRIRAQDPEFPVGTAWSFDLPGLLLVGGGGRGRSGLQSSLGSRLTAATSRTSTQPSRIESPTTLTSEWTEKQS